MAYLKKPENLRKLVLYVIGQPPTKPGEAERESDVRTRHSLAACEALCSLIEELPELIAENESLLRTLFSATGGVLCYASCLRARISADTTGDTANCRGLSKAPSALLSVFALLISAFIAAMHEQCISELALTKLVHVAETGMADDCALAGYFSRLLGILLSRSADQIMGYLKASILVYQTCSLCTNPSKMGLLYSFTIPVCISREGEVTQTGRPHCMSLD